MSKKQTAVEWLEQQTRMPDWHSLKRGEIIEQAKELEKQDLIDAFDAGATNGINHDIVFDDDAENYYNNTFNE